MKKYNLFLFGILVLLCTSSCKYDFILPEVVPVVNDVSFSQSVAPIFSNGNKCTSCHDGTANPINLTANSAYAQITAKLINTTTPEESLIYSFPAPTTNTHNWKKYTATEAATILQWIKEGAKNN